AKIIIYHCEADTDDNEHGLILRPIESPPIALGALTNGDKKWVCLQDFLPSGFITPDLFQVKSRLKAELCLDG
ncbi:unnamed protein product, partial [Heterosigma akashiwo]